MSDGKKEDEDGVEEEDNVEEEGRRDGSGGGDAGRAGGTEGDRSGSSGDEVRDRVGDGVSGSVGGSIGSGERGIEPNEENEGLTRKLIRRRKKKSKPPIKPKGDEPDQYRRASPKMTFTLTAGNAKFIEFACGADAKRFPYHSSVVNRALHLMRKDLAENPAGK